jgi:hypothetical protein
MQSASEGSVTQLRTLLDKSLCTVPTALLCTPFTQLSCIENVLHEPDGGMAVVKCSSANLKALQNSGEC